jgi:hypothetical protein
MCVTIQYNEYFLQLFIVDRKYWQKLILQNIYTCELIVIFGYNATADILKDRI